MRAYNVNQFLVSKVTALDLSLDAYCCVLEKLLPEEQARINRFKRPTAEGYLVRNENIDAKRSIIGRCMLKWMANSCLA